MQYISKYKQFLFSFFANPTLVAELESEIPVCKINFRFSISLARLNSGKLKLLYFSGS